MAEEIPRTATGDDNEPKINGSVQENGESKDEIDEELDDAMFDDPEGFVDDVSDQGMTF